MSPGLMNCTYAGSRRSSWSGAKSRMNPSGATGRPSPRISAQSLGMATWASSLARASGSPPWQMTHWSPGMGPCACSMPWWQVRQLSPSRGGGSLLGHPVAAVSNNAGRTQSKREVIERSTSNLNRHGLLDGRHRHSVVHDRHLEDRFAAVEAHELIIRAVSLGVEADDRARDQAASVLVVHTQQRCVRQGKRAFGDTVDQDVELNVGECVVARVQPLGPNDDGDAEATLRRDGERDLLAVFEGGKRSTDPLTDASEDAQGSVSEGVSSQPLRKSPKAKHVSAALAMRAENSATPRSEPLQPLRTPMECARGGARACRACRSLCATIRAATS